MFASSSRPRARVGTCSRGKSSFYHLAIAAKVPVALSSVDYAKRETGVGTCIELIGDPDADMRVIAAFHADKVAKYPAQVGPVRFGTGRSDTATP